MNPEIKKQWLAALRSGEYTQGQGKLRILAAPDPCWPDPEPRFCCLGVLCDIWARETDHTWEDVREAVEEDNDGDDVLPSRVRDWAGLDDKNPIPEGGGTFKDTLAGLNDDGTSFEDIAERIERGL